MSSQTSFGSSMLFQTINDDLNASLATADELSKEFSSLFQEASTPTQSQTSFEIARQPLQSDKLSISASVTSPDSGGSSNGKATLMPFSPSTFPLDSTTSCNKNICSSPILSPSPHNSPQLRRKAHSPLLPSNNFPYRQPSPCHSPRMQRHSSPLHYSQGLPGSPSYRESNLSLSSTASSFNESSPPTVFHPTANLSPYDANQMGRRSPRPDRRSPSPSPFNQQISSTLPRNFGGFKQTDEAMQRQKSPSKWNESDLDASYERKPHHSYDNKEWLRPSVPNSSWRESNLDGPPPTPSPKKDRVSHTLQPAHHASLPRNARISVPPDMVSPNQSPYHSQPIISRISIPPVSANTRQRKPIPLSVIMRLQNPHWATAPTHHPSVPLPREFYPQPPPPELKQPPFYGEVLNPGDIDAELERLDLIHHMPVIAESPSTSEAGGEVHAVPAPAPRPLSPTRLQPVVAPEAQIQEIPDLEELLRIRAEIPRALKRRGSVEQSRPMKKTSLYQPNQYKQLINKLFRRKGLQYKGEQGSEASSSSSEEESPIPSPHGPVPQTSTQIPQDHKGYHSILRRSKQNKPSGRRARLSPLVLLLDGALVGELDTVQKAVQEMNDPSQPNDEGITALHNAICGGHYNLVDFLVRIGANVSAPDSHGWTPLHCAASCNDRPLCEFLVRNGAAVMAVTESDGATASQKCDPYAVGYEECENFLRGVEEAMGVENSGVLYALWNYPSQAPDELSFKEGDMVTILQKQDRMDWWWASLCGREGFVPNNYFGLFPKVRPRSLC